MRRIGHAAALLLLALTLWPVLAPAREVPDTMAQRALACTGCHGPQGQSRPEGYVPRLAGKPAGYLRRFLPAQPTMRREAIGDPRELLTTLQQADAGAAERYSAHQIDQGRRAQQRAPVCATASL